MFSHKGLAIISQGFWVTFAFDSSLSILMQSKSSFESYLANSPQNEVGMYKNVKQVDLSLPIPYRCGLVFSRVMAGQAHAGCGYQKAGPIPPCISAHSLTSRPAGWTANECIMTLLYAAGCSSAPGHFKLIQ